MPKSKHKAEPFRGPRSGAKSVGAKYYFPASKCVHGHTSLRFTENGSCVECVKLRPQKVFPLVCEHCGKLVMVRRREKGRVQRFCSMKCFGAAVVAKPRVCPQCGVTFVNWNNKKFCSRRCFAASRTGVPMSKEHRLALCGPRCHIRGSASAFWKGGHSTERNTERVRWEYKTWRASVFSRDHFTCQACLRVGGSLEAHHIVRWIDDASLRYSISNGITLCRACHCALHLTAPNRHASVLAG